MGESFMKGNRGYAGLIWPLFFTAVYYLAFSGIVTILLNRLEKYQKNHLLFLHNFSVPFDNNMSERDLRKAKNRQKMAGGFRKESGNEMYCAILTIVETLKRRKMGLIENLKKIFMGTPAIF